ncbi:MAG: hypothetical protein QXF69_05510 [Thermofilaceae archaeon]
MGVLVVNRLFNGDLDVLQAMGGAVKLYWKGLDFVRKGDRERRSSAQCGAESVVSYW